MKKIMFGMPAILVAASLFTFSNADAREIVQIKGSDTLINVVQRLSEVYMEKNPGKMISVTGGGSGTGITALVNKRCDIANASRLMKPKEIELAVSQGVNPKQVVVAIDGLSIVVNKDNPVDKLTVEQVGAIYRGDIKNWKEVGGEDMPITLYGRQSNSGTYDFMMEVVMKGDYSTKMRGMNGNAQIIEALKTDKSGVGYVGVGYAKGAEGVTVLKIAVRIGGEYASPLEAGAVESGKYPISRPLNQYVDKVSDDVKGFIDFELSVEGQKIVEEEGFFQVPKEYAELNARNGF